MKPTFKDLQQDFLMLLLRPLVFIWMRLDAKRIVHRDPSFRFIRKEPYVMLANHTFMFDVVHVPLRLFKVPFIIASQTLFTKQPSKFLVSQVAHVIPKSKGRSDSQTILKIFSAVKRGYPILIFPEGDTTFFGETNYIESSTMKLIKKLKLDVVVCNVKGGYLGKPRWATSPRKHRQIELNYKVEITKEELSNLSVEEINDRVVKALYHNDYEYQKQKMIPHPGTELAHGIENAVYVCPHCEAINTIESIGNKVRCSACHKEGSIDQYGFIHDFVFDNLVEWNQFQRGFSEKLRQTKVTSTGMLYHVKMENDAQDLLGEVTLTYDKGYFTISGATALKMPINEITNPTITLRRDFGFVYQDTHYLIKLDHYGLTFLRIVQDKY